MRTSQDNFIKSMACGVALALSSAAPFHFTRANINTSYNNSLRNLAGTWRINREKSEDPHNKISEAIAKGHADGLRGGSSSAVGLPDGGGVPGRQEHESVFAGGTSSVAEQIESVRLELEEQMRAADLLEIIQTDSEITVNEIGDSRLVYTRTFYTDGRKSEQDTDNGKLETKAKWRSNKFVVETNVEDLGKMTRTYELQSGGRELYFTLKIENERMPQSISVRSIYDRSQ